MFLSLILLSGCIPNTRIDALAARLTLAEQRLTLAERKLRQLEEEQPPGRERLAAALFLSAKEAYVELDLKTAQSELQKLEQDFQGTEAAERAKNLTRDLGTLGTPITELRVEKWLQGSADRTESTVTLVVFWEIWCPHCIREIPKLQQLYETYSDQGLNIVGLTKMTRGATENEVTSFLKKRHIHYPIAKEHNAEMSSLFQIVGVPAAAVLKNGEIIWRGHPGRITPDYVEHWLAQ